MAPWLLGTREVSSVAVAGLVHEEWEKAWKREPEPAARLQRFGVSTAPP
jgi:hypothetical protein